MAMHYTNLKTSSAGSKPMLETIESIIYEALPDATVFVANPDNDGKHFEALVISPSFQTMTLVKQHQVVMNALKSALETQVHALALKTFTPEKWNEKKHLYNVNLEETTNDKQRRKCKRPNRKRN